MNFEHGLEFTVWHAQWQSYCVVGRKRAPFAVHSLVWMWLHLPVKSRHCTDDNASWPVLTTGSCSQELLATACPCVRRAGKEPLSAAGLTAVSDAGLGGASVAVWGEPDCSIQTRWKQHGLDLSVDVELALANTPILLPGGLERDGRANGQYIQAKHESKYHLPPTPRLKVLTENITLGVF